MYGYKKDIEKGSCGEMSHSVIRLQNVSKAYKDVSVLNHVSIDFEQGKSYGIKGINGSGKSVLLKLIAGYAFADSGSIVIRGKTLKKDMDFIENAGVVINAPTFMNGLSAYKNLQFLADIRHVIGKTEIQKILEELQLWQAKDKKVTTYSEGMKQRLRLAQAFMEAPDILLLDEPMNALDKEGITLVKSLLKRHVESGKTLLFTSHNKEDLDDLADEKLEIECGQITRMAETA